MTDPSRPSDATPFLAELREQLLAAAQRQVAARRRRRRAALGSATAVLVGAVAAVALVLGTQPSTAAADVVVRVRDGIVTVTLVDLEHRPDRIEAAVRAAGLDVDVVAVPVGPSNVGRFVGVEVAGEAAPELHRIGADGESFAGFALPESWRGSLRLLVGEPAAEDEGYAVFSDATAPGEALACQPVVGRSLDLVTGALLAADRHPRGLATEGTRTVPLAVADLVEGSYGAWVVVGVDATDAEDLLVRLAPPGTTRTVRPHPGCTSREDL